MQGVVLYSGAIGLASGIFFRSLFQLPNTFFILMCATACVGICVWYAQVSKVAKTYLKNIGVGLIFCIAFAAGAWRYAAEVHLFAQSTQALQSFEEQKVEIHGTIVEEVEDRDIEQVLLVRIATGSHEVPETVVRVTTQIPVKFEYGDAVVVKGVLRVPRSFQTDTARTFLYKEYLETQGVTHTMSFASVQKIHEGSHSFLRTLYGAKKYFVDTLALLLPEPQAGFAAGLLLGEKRALGQHLNEVFRTVGVVHIIVLSGYNLTIVAESIMRLLSFVFLPRMRAFVGVVSLCVFAVMVGLSATVMRAACMAVLVLVARAFGRDSEALRGLAFAACGMLLWNPYILLFDPGFQLSFLATLGLIVVSPLLEEWVAWVPTHFQLREYVVSTLATQVFVTPFLLYAMGTVSVVALCANVLILSVVPLSMLFSFVAGVFGIIFGASVYYVAFPAYLLLSYMLFVAEMLARVPFASFEVPPFSVWYMIALYSCIGALLYWYAQHKKTASLV